ncbi:MAG: transposase, partial [bacterium]|nr:transposase [bacterium]
LMPNHFHFEMRQNADVSISKLLTKISTSYSKYYNKKYDHTGHIFQDQFKSVLITGDEQLLWLSAYIHANPLVAGLVKRLEDWQWGSYPDYIGLRQGTLCEKASILDQFKSVEEYRKFVESSVVEIKKRKEMESLLLD